MVNEMKRMKTVQTERMFVKTSDPATHIHGQM